MSQEEREKKTIPIVKIETKRDLGRVAIDVATARVREVTIFSKK